MELEVEREARRRDAEENEVPEQWRTSLKLSMPRLGSIDSTLQLTQTGIRIAISSPVAISAEDLRQAVPALAQSLESAGLKVLDVQVRNAEG